MTTPTLTAAVADQSSNPDISAITALCKGAGDPLRMQILKVLQQNAYGVLELCQVFDIRQSGIGQNL